MCKEELQATGFYFGFHTPPNAAQEPGSSIPQMKDKNTQESTWEKGRENFLTNLMKRI